MGRQKQRLPEKQSSLVQNFSAKNDRQQELINSIRNNTVTFAIGASGTGKTIVALATALNMLNNVYKKIVLVKSVTSIPGENIGFIPGPQPLDTQVVTPYGWKRFGDLKIGEEVIGRDGFPTKVIGIYPKGLKDTYRITLGDGRSTEACGDHVWPTNKYDGTYERFVSTKFMFDNIESKKFFLPLNQAVQYDQIEVPIDGYLVGVFLGDGIISGSHVRFCSNDQEIIDNIKEIVTPYGLELTNQNLIYTITNTRNNTQAGSREMARKNLLTEEIEILGYLKEAIKKLNIKDSTLIGRCTRNSIVDNYQYFFTGNISKASNYVKQTLIDLDMFGKKSYEKRIPSLYLHAGIETRISLLQGLLDTDGTIKKEGKDLVYYTSSEELADDVVELVYSLGGTTRKHFRDRIGRIQERPTGNIENKRICYEIYINFYNDLFNPFKLSRKAERFKPKTTYHYATKVVKIEKIEQKEVQCIKVDNSDHLYLTDNFIVTHNTMEDKMAPFMYSFTGNIDKLCGLKASEELIRKSIVEVQPIAFIRGINIDNAIVILDETQNLDSHTFKSIITRIGSDSKYIVLGDVEQIDKKDKGSSCLQKMVDIFKDTDDIGTIQFQPEDCIRNPIIPKILSKLKENNL